MEEATESFEKAYLLDPDYRYAGRELLEIHVEKKNYERAREIWKSLTHFTPSPFILVDGITIELADGNQERAAEMAEELLAMDFSNSSDPLEYAEWAFQKNKQATMWDVCLFEKMKGNPSREIVSAWARSCIDRGHLAKTIRRLKKFPFPFERKAGAWSLILEHLEETNDAQGSNELVRKNWADFRSDPQTWTEVGYNLTHYGKDDEAARWFSDWRDRGDEVTARDYLNIASALLRHANVAAAKEAVQAGLFRFRTGSMAESLRIESRFLSEVLARGEEADQMAAISELEESSPFFQSINQLSNAMRSAREGDFEEAEKTFKEVGEEWSEWLADPVYAIYFKTTADRLSQLLPKYRGKPKKLLKVGGKKSQNLIEKWGSERLIVVVLLGLYILFRIIGALND